MKNSILKTSLLLIFILTILGSCNRDDQDDSKNTNDTFYFTTKIDNVDFSGDLSNPATFGAFKYHAGTLTISIPKDVNSPSSGAFLLNILSGYNGSGTYKVGIGSTGNNYARYSLGSMATNNLKFWSAETGSSSTSNTIGTGTITISSDTNNIVEGTFQFSGYSNEDATTKQFSEGKFRLKINP